jgi:hypothetical protein
MRIIFGALTTGKYILLAVVAALTLATASVAVAGSGMGRKIVQILRRRKVTTSVVVVALTLGVVSSAFAANGGNFILGVLSNSATAVTRLTMTGTASGSVLQLIQQSTATGASGLGITVPTGKAPITVNSTAGKATNLNADKVDNLNANELVRGDSQWAFVNTSNPSHSADVYTASAPRQGGLLINLDFACASFIGSTNTRWDINLRVDGANDARSQPSLVRFSHADLTSYPVDSTSVTSFVPVSAGTHTIGYLASQSEGDGSLDCNINASSIFVPFNDAGGAPTASAADQAPSQQMLEGKGANR